MPRFAILEHTAAPDDPAGRHYDLLLEDGPACRTWRLADLPAPGGPVIAAAALQPHRLAWLDHEAGAVSGGRGFARRIDSGTYEPTATDRTTPDSDIDVVLHGGRIRGRLMFRARADGWLASLT